MNISAIAETFKEAGIRCETSADEIRTAAKDASQLKSEPLCVVYPDSARQIAETVRICNKAGRPVTVAGGYTGLSGGVLGYKAVRIETRQLNAFEIQGNMIKAQAGASVPGMMRACAARDLVFPCQPASACRTEDVYEYLGTQVGPVTLGGSLGANASGLVGCKLGAALPWVRELSLVKPDGSAVTVSDGFERYVGTEGRWAIITDAVLELAPVPENPQTYLISGTGLDAFTQTASAIGESGALPLLAEAMLMAAEPPDFTGLARRIFSNADDFLARFGPIFGPHAWLVLLQGTPEETGACLKSIAAAGAEAVVRELEEEDFKRIKQIRSAASDEIGSGVSNPNRNPDDAPPIQRAARFLAEAIAEFMRRGIRPKAEHNYGMLRVFLETEEERTAFCTAVENGDAFDDGSLEIHRRYHGDLAAFLEAFLAPRVTDGMRQERIAVNFPGNEDILIPISRFAETIALLDQLMRTYNACPVPLYYCHINFRRQPGWVLLHNRLLIDVAEFREEEE